MKKEKLIPKVFRVNKKHNKFIKKEAKRVGGESEYIRGILDEKMA